MTALHDRSAVELLALYARREASPVEVLNDLLAHIEHCEPKIAALWALDAEGASAAARDSEARWQRGEALPLDGVPVTVKDNIATRGVPVPLAVRQPCSCPPRPTHRRRRACARPAR